MTITESVQASQEYRFRYRAKNFNGWGPLSEISYYIAATKPNRPPAPVYVYSTSTTVTLQLLAPEVLGGSPLTKFKLYVDTLQSFANYRLIYEGVAPLYTVTVSKDNVVTGTNYRFTIVATNVFGDSPMSEETRIALG